MNHLKFALIALLAVQPAFAAEVPPSEASIHELMDLTQSRKMLDSMMEQIDGVMQQSMQQALAGQKFSPEQQAIMDELRSSVIALFKQEMKWESLDPMLVDVYRKSFNQKEVDGMIAFYKSEPGQAVIAKMPLVMQHTMVAMQERMADIAPKLQQLQQDAIAKLQATKGKK
jgi:uncharacterized protein